MNLEDTPIANTYKYITFVKSNSSLNRRKTEKTGKNKMDTLSKTIPRTSYMIWLCRNSKTFQQIKLEGDDYIPMKPVLPTKF